MNRVHAAWSIDDDVDAKDDNENTPLRLHEPDDIIAIV